MILGELPPPTFMFLGRSIGIACHVAVMAHPRRPIGAAAISVNL